MATLHLTLKKKWFDMIESGEKKEEYREIKPYWVNRLVWILDSEILENSSAYDEFITDLKSPTLRHRSLDELMKYFNSEFAFVQRIVFHHGYSKGHRQMVVECKGIDIGTAKPEWSDNWQGNVFRIKLGNIIS